MEKILKNFCHMIKRQFDVHIKGFRTKNAKDFCNHELKEFFEGKGIRHETSCPYTPQQIGLAERKIGDIMDKARTLMIQASLPKNLWNFPIMTVVHLINRLSSKVIGYHSSTELIEKQFPKVKLRNRLKPRVFGCVVFIHTHNMPSNKLFARAIRGVFVGYSTTQKGYRFYDPTFKCIFVTNDAFFDENSFFILTIPPSTVDTYLSLPTQDEYAAMRIEDSLLLQYPSLHTSEAPILDQRTPNLEGETFIPQPTSFTYFPKYYVRGKTMEPPTSLPSRASQLNWSMNSYLNTLG